MAEIIQRQEFICKLARSFMMFGGPSHRLQAQILATARVLDVTCSCMYLPDMMLVSFDDVATGTSNIKLVRQGGAFDIYKLQEAYKLYWKVSLSVPILCLGPIRIPRVVCLSAYSTHMRSRYGRTPWAWDGGWVRTPRDNVSAET